MVTMVVLVGCDTARYSRRWDCGCLKTFVTVYDQWNRQPLSFGRVLSLLRVIRSKNLYILQNLDNWHFRKINLFRKFSFSYKPASFFWDIGKQMIAPDMTPQNAASHLGLFCFF